MSKDPQRVVAATPGSNANESEDGDSTAGTPDLPLNPGDEARPGTPGTGENVCRRCGGSGRTEGGGSCPECGGSGHVTTNVGDA
jgi:hypothetical protein